MAEYNGMILTKAGMQLQVQAQIGGELHITKIAIGDGMLAAGESIEDLTALKSLKMTLGIQDMQAMNGQSRIRALISNENLDTGFFVREVGVFAKIGETGTETLYSYTNAGDKADYLPNKGINVVEEVLEIYIVVGNAQNVTCLIDDRVTLATKQDIEEHNNDMNAHSQAIEKHNTSLTVHAELLHLWQPNHAYVVGDICYSAIGSSYKRFECTKAGTSGTMEPTWGSVGNVMADGTAVWAVRDMRIADAQFDNSAKLATTAFVQKTVGNYCGRNSYTGSTTLTAINDAGKVIAFSSATAITCTMPLGAGLPIGVSFYITNANTGQLTIAPQGSDSIFMSGYGSAVNPVLASGDSALLVWSGFWSIIGGSIQLKYAGSFGSLQSSNGYQKLPSGLIIQWGTYTSQIPVNVNATITFPVAFPNNVLSITGSYRISTFGNSTGPVFSIASYTNSQFVQLNDGETGNNTGFFWMAIGY